MRKFPRLLIIIFLFALFLRLFKLNDFPLGFHVDEAKIGYFALNHPNIFTLYFNSFGDFRPTGIFYLSMPFIYLFGKTVFAVRFSAALLGALTTIPIFYLAHQITENKKVAYFSSFILAIIPWHLVTSRATSEVVISCFLVLSSLVLVRKKPNISFIILSLSFFFYHSARVMGPLLMFSWIIYLTSRKDLKLSKKYLIGFLFSTLVALILVSSSTGLARYNQVKLPSFSLRNLILNYTTYFNPNFFVGDIAKPFRYMSTNLGIVSLPVFVLFLFGVFIIIKTNKSKILFILFLLGPLPASLTLEDSPNLHRAFFILPFLIIIAAIGVNFLYEKHQLIYRFIIFCMLWSFMSFLLSYFSTQNNFAYPYRDPNMLELVQYLNEQKNNYSKIYVTNDPDSPSPWFYYLESKDPGNIFWTENKCPAANAFDEARKNNLTKIMVIDQGDCYSDFKNQPKAKMIKEFKYEETVNYRVWKY